MKVVIGADHAGFELKQFLIEARPAIEWIDAGTNSLESVDYPDFAAKAANEVESGRALFGILICGSGIGMSIAANRKPGVRAALCFNEEMVKLSREHNDANILCIGARFTPREEALHWIDLFLNHPGATGERHLNRVKKLGT